MKVTSEINERFTIINSGISLEMYRPEYDLALKTFTLPENQRKFTLLPSEMIRRAEGDPTRHSVVILCEGEPVGFFVLRSGEVVRDYSDNPRALLLVALCVNYSQQGKGYAKKGLQFLKFFVSEHFDDINEVVLAVNENNINAQILYKKLGFKDTGKRKLGKLGETFIYSLSLV